MTRSVIIGCLFLSNLGCQNSPLNRILKNAPESVTNVISNPREYGAQIVYVQIDRDQANQPSFRTYTHRSDKDAYFYPASTVKLPMSLLALEKLNDMQIPGLDKHVRMQTDSVRPPQSRVLLDTTSASGVPSVAHYIRKIFIVSDNDAFNRLYELVGWDEIQDRLSGKGLTSTRIIHRLSDARFGPAENRCTNPVQFFNSDTLVYAQQEQCAKDSIIFRPRGEQKGVAFIDRDGNLVPEPFDFSMKNFFPLEDQVRALKALYFPSSVPPENRFNLTQDDYRFVYDAMSTLPAESRFPVYDTTTHPDSYVKFFMYGDSKSPIPGHVRIFNKVGWAYGYLTDCAYVVDFENEIEFIVAATVHVNANKTYNDGIYEFDEAGIPFMAELGRQVYAYELSREREYRPDLSHLNFTRKYD